MDKKKMLLAIGISSLALFVILSLMVEMGMTQGFDDNMNRVYTSYENELLIRASMLFHNIFSTKSVGLVSILMASVLFYRKMRTEAQMLMAGVFSHVIIVSLFKEMIARARPSLFMVDVPNLSHYSFPSGHASISMVFVGIVALISFEFIRTRRIRYLTGVMAGVLIGLVGFSRIYLGVHYFTDVFGGFLVGTAILAFVAYVFKKHEIFFSMYKK